MFLTGAGAVASSSDGERWSIQRISLESSIWSIAGGSDRILGVGETREGAVIFKWTEEQGFTRVADAPGYFIKIVYGNGVFVAGGGSVYVSRDGLEWQEALGEIHERIDLTFGGGKFLAAAKGRMYVSADGMAWQDSGLAATQVAYYGGVYGAVSGAKVLFSRDGVQWKTHEIPTLTFVRRLVMGAEGVVVLGGTTNGYPRAYFSPDYEGWGTLHDNLPEWISGCAYFKDRYLVAGAGGHIAHSFNGFSWHDQVPQSASTLYQTAASDSTIVALRSGEGLWSTNGIDWHPSGPLPEHIFQDVAYGSGRFVAVTYEGMIIYSDDGKRWRPAELSHLISTKKYAVCYGVDGFVVLGSREVFRSRTGERWELAGGFSDSFTSIAYGNGVYVATAGGGRGGYSLISTNLKNWTVIQPKSTDGDVVFGNERFVMLRGSQAFISTNGLDWTAGQRVDAGKLSFSEGVFTADGQYDSHVSVDGLVWHRLPQTPVKTQAEHYLGRIFAFGGYRAVLELENFASVAMGFQGQRLTLKPVVSDRRPHKWQRSADLREWMDVESPDAAGLEVDVERPVSAFFRTVAED